MLKFRRRMQDTSHGPKTYVAPGTRIAGTVEGDVIGEQRVEISGTARVTGSLAGHSIAVAEGAVIEGDIKVRSGTAPITFQEKRGTDVQAQAPTKIHAHS